MAEFKLIKEELFVAGYKNYYRVEAETIEDALARINDDEVDPYDSEIIPIFDLDPLETKVLNEDGDVIYAIKHLQ